MLDYIALLRKDPDSDYSVEFPDFPGCVTAGTSLEEARKFAAEALELHVNGLLEDQEELPFPRTLDQVMLHPAHADAVVFLVSLPDPRPKVVRVNVTFPEDVLKRIDEAAAKEVVTRSYFLQEAALQKIAKASR